ncbi:hypothetical protein HG530_006984 [Fusarium avenaceum]|nr:hypothetical protein HG530_006984 [Fusarium avenaceum]
MRPAGLEHSKKADKLLEGSLPNILALLSVCVTPLIDFMGVLNKSHPVDRTVAADPFEECHGMSKFLPADGLRPAMQYRLSGYSDFLDLGDSPVQPIGD